ncbi:Pvc16 family protein [Lentzea sp. NEAU-D7]|uniref:Pvc16 family protein n=1 Tax=Lentzea sp. NEAU-D7 TaxID=2994667 RepID=UPI00224B683B|nr:Pvc16 family protein [Lentzea sp. NEAU-D7]MCX2954585.1 Pvc16 family protein [Lentzea sp. NEAU-D7]
MFEDVNASLAALLHTAIAKDVAVEFGPVVDGAGAEKRSVVLTFLHIERCVTGMELDWTDVRDEKGKVVARMPPTHRYCLHYLVTASAGATADLELLGSTLEVLGSYNAVPRALSRGPLRDSTWPVALEVAPAAPLQDTLDIWAALRADPRPALRLLVTAPMVPAPITSLEATPEGVTLGATRKQ